MEPKDFNAILNKYIEDTTEKGSSYGFTGQLTNIRHNMDSREQFEMLSTVSNYHSLGFPSTQDPQKIKTPNISFHEHIATPEQQRYIPASPCNRIMYFIKSGELRHLKNYLKFLQLKDNIPEFQTDEPPHKKQRLTGRARRVDAFCLKQKYLSPELADMIRQSNIDRSLYTKFKNQLLTSGTIKWHYNQDGRNVCIMNDYSVNEHLMPNSFVHISSEFTDDDTPVIHCSCQIYNFIQNVEIEEGSEIAPETSCIHCRFFQEHLLNAYEVINQGCTNIARPLEMVKSSIQFMNDPVLLLSDVLRTGTTKYSVKGDDYFSLVTVNFAGGICYIKCHSGFCAAANMNKKRMPRSAKLNESAKLCSHLQTCYANIDTITCDFPQYFNQLDDIVDDNENGNFGEDINTEDYGSLSSELESNFDKETGLWSYKSLSQYKPMMSDNKNLHFSARERIQFVVNYEPNRIIEL